MRVVISGASGLLGTALTEQLERDKVEVTRLVRQSPRTRSEVAWDPHAPAGALPHGVLSGADCVVHLSGASVAGGRWTEGRKRVLRESRIGTTTALVQAIAAAPDPPAALLCASAIGWYGDTGDRPVDETAQAGSGFLAELVHDWEAAAAPAREAGSRVVNLRSGLVMTGRGGILGPLLPLFRLGLGATFGSGRQYLSWIALTDHLRAIRFLMDNGAVSGPVNLTAPEPVTNSEFAATLARALGRPAFLRVPGPLIQVGLGEASSELLGGARVLPARLQQAGFSYRFPDLASALRAELAPGT